MGRQKHDLNKLQKYGNRSHQKPPLEHHRLPGQIHQNTVNITIRRLGKRKPDSNISKNQSKSDHTTIYNKEYALQTSTKSREDP